MVSTGISDGEGSIYYLKWTLIYTNSYELFILRRYLAKKFHDRNLTNPNVNRLSAKTSYNF